VLLPGKDVRLLGGSVRERNARVAERAGCRIVGPDELPDTDEPALLVPAHMAIDLALFPVPRRSSVVQIVSAAGAHAATHLLAGPSRALRRLISARAHLSLPREQALPEALFDLSTPGRRRRAAWAILKRTTKPSDGWVSRHFNRPVSRLVSFAMLSAGFRAAHGSALTLCAGLCAAGAATGPGHAALVATGILFQLASIIDGVDGEMARATLTESAAGARLDTIVDQFTYLACFTGVTIGWMREGRPGEALTWSMAVTAALLLSLWRGARFVARSAPANPSFVFIDRCVRRAARETGDTALRFAALAFTLLRRDLFSVIFLLASLLGERALIVRLVAVGIVLANATLTLYNRELEAAARAEQSA
jgi:phosphatidylglycerophosphate synthase